MAASSLPLVYLVRHGETAWSRTGQHTGLTDIPLTEQGERNATGLASRLSDYSFSRVFKSPLQRASRTCELAGFGAIATADPDLVEWNYGDFEGKTSAEIHQQHPEWNLFQHGCPGGESIADVEQRAGRVVRRIRGVDGNVLIFSSSHFLRALTAVWLGLSAAEGRYFILDTASISILSYEHELSSPVIRRWNT